MEQSCSRGRGGGRRALATLAALAVAAAAACSPNPSSVDATSTSAAPVSSTSVVAATTTAPPPTSTSTTVAATTTTVAEPAGPVLTFARTPVGRQRVLDAVTTSSTLTTLAVPGAPALAVLWMRAEWPAPSGTGPQVVTVVPPGGPGATLVAPADANALSGRVTVRADGLLSITAPPGARLTVDLVDTYAPVRSARAGRYVPLVAGAVAASQTFRRGAETSLALPDAVAADATAVRVRVTVAPGTAPGSWWVAPAGADATATAPVVDDATPGPSAAATVALGSERSLVVRSAVGGRARVEVLGWFTGPSGDDTAAGLYVPVVGDVVLDTAADAAPVAAAGRVRATWPTDVAAVDGAVTVTGALSPGRASLAGVDVDIADGALVTAPLVSADPALATVAGPADVTVRVSGVYVAAGADAATVSDRVHTAAVEVSARWRPPLDGITAAAVPADVILPTGDATLDPATNPINGRRSTARPTTAGFGCTVAAIGVRACLRATLDALGFDVGGTTVLDRQRLLQQAVAVVQLDAGLPATGVADAALLRYLGIDGTEPGPPAEARTIGTSRQGRPIRALRYGTGPKVVLVVGQTHGDEEAGLRVWFRLRGARIPDGLTVWVVPMASPDGVANDTRFLPGGHDPNRAAPREPEQQAVYDFAVAVRPVLAVYYHQNYGWIGGSGASMDPARDYFARTGLGSLKRSGDCALGFLWCPIDDAVGSSSILVELPDVVTPDEVQRHAAALLAVATDVVPVPPTTTTSAPG